VVDLQRVSKLGDVSHINNGTLPEGLRKVTIPSVVLKEFQDIVFKGGEKPDDEEHVQDVEWEDVLAAGLQVATRLAADFGWLIEVRRRTRSPLQTVCCGDDRCCILFCARREYTYASCKIRNWPFGRALQRATK